VIRRENSAITTSINPVKCWYPSGSAIIFFDNSRLSVHGHIIILSSLERYTSSPWFRSFYEIVSLECSAFNGYAMDHLIVSLECSAFKGYAMTHLIFSRECSALWGHSTNHTWYRKRTGEFLRSVAFVCFSKYNVWWNINIMMPITFTR
jgi:hypothetical protein